MCAEKNSVQTTRWLCRHENSFLCLINVHHQEQSLEMKIFHLSLSAGFLALTLSGATCAAPILIDFQPTGGTVQSGFVAITSNAATNISGVTFQTTGLFFDRNPGFANAGAFTYEDLLDDFAYTNATAGSPSTAPTITLTMTGLAASTDYDLRIWSGDQFACAGTVWDCNVTTTFTTVVGSGAVSSVLFDSSTNPATNNQYSGFGTVMSDGAGAITLNIVGSAPFGQAYTRLNGLSLEQSSVVPLPATLALFGLGLAGLGYQQQRKAVKAA